MREREREKETETQRETQRDRKRGRDRGRERQKIRRVPYHSYQINDQAMKSYHYLSTCAVISSNEFSGLSRDLISPLISQGLSAINSPAKRMKRVEKRRVEKR